ncbi:MAG: cyclic lactone autoinducer peptide [Lachnospiraceae bacterium]|jgi:cyclic lactone autoinducer peptide|nr:cyclic lactone autoinducer peptide [Lachnospiraceae bacterium]
MKKNIGKINHNMQKGMAVIAEKMVEKADGHICFYIFHQPKMPKEVVLFLEEKKMKNGKNSRSDSDYVNKE